MAGEWIAYDLALPGKPEVQELIDLTGKPVETVVFRLLQLWGWAAVNCDAGEARMTLPRLARVCGGDEDFWRHVAAVGWLEINETAATVSIPGWDRRFSQAAKSRLQEAGRKRAYEERNPGRKQASPDSDGGASDRPTVERRNVRRPGVADRGDRGDRGELPPPPPPPADAGDWGRLRAAWNAGPGRPWKPAEPPDGLAERLAEPGWLTEALEAIPRLAACRFFRTAPTLLQFVRPGFARRVLGGQYDEAKPERAGRDERPPPIPIAQRRCWRGDAERSMNDAEYAAWRRDQAAGGSSSAVADGLRVRSAGGDVEAARSEVLEQLRRAEA